ncbi:MAG: flagellar brake protein [Deltaproteobacteria bacterium]|jgi:c-di-GMP-binding flagellar brake protein YcgR|nr:flagellar brake protein [Deltaproteobacteria bacterium]
MKNGLSLLNSETLSPGQRVRLLAMETTKSKWTTVLIGSKIGQYLILEVPKVNNLPIVLDDHSQWAVNFINQGLIFSFNSEIISSILRPFPLVFISFPSETQVSNLRTDKRYPVHIQAIFKILGPWPGSTAAEAQGSSHLSFSSAEASTASPTIIKGLILDLSWGGCLVATTYELPKNSLVSLTLYLEDPEPIEGLLTTRMACRQLRGTFYTGLSFLNVTPSEVIDRLNDFLSDIERKPLRF